MRGRGVIVKVQKYYSPEPDVHGAKLGLAYKKHVH